MKTIRWLVIIALAALAGMLGYSYSRNPEVPMMAHADAVGFVLARPFTAGAWRGLTCTHRGIVNDLVTKSLGPKVCGLPGDGGAAARAKRFQTEGPMGCWALYEQLSQSYEDRFADVIAKKSPASGAAGDFCRRAGELLKAG
jgi:hypothetical protein